MKEGIPMFGVYGTLFLVTTDHASDRRVLSKSKDGQDHTGPDDPLTLDDDNDE